MVRRTREEPLPAGARQLRTAVMPITALTPTPSALSLEETSTIVDNSGTYAQGFTGKAQGTIERIVAGLAGAAAN